MDRIIDGQAVTGQASIALYSEVPIEAVKEERVLTTTTTLKTTKSEEIFAAAQKLMPGGVNSPVRAFKSVGGQPIVFDRVKGAYAWDVDGNQYIDYIGTWGPAICGHAHPEVLAALKDALEKGTSFGAPSYLENVLAEMVIDAVPSIEMVRFVNSGTEACMAVLRLMRAYTGREKLIKFEGCYHGHADMFLVKAGSGVATLGLPDSPGVPKSTTANTLTAPFNDLEAVKALFAENPDQIAGVLLEPVVGNAGFIPPDAGFLEGLRLITQEHGALLVFDEVMTGFRIAYGGAQERFGVTPDLTTLGKIIGGGLPVGAYGGRQDIMSMVAPAGPMYQAGTLSGNPLAMTAGIKTLELLQRPGTYEQLDRITKKLADGMLQVAQETGHVACGGAISAMFGFFFAEGPIHNYEDAKKSDLAKFARFHRGMLEQGVYLAPSQFEAGFTSLAHTDEDIDRTLAAARTVMSNL
jgi:glutamate-1-semialdehyde 2,1-aminomutase